MDPRELAILEEIETELTQADARFAARMAAGPSLTFAYRFWLAGAAVLGVSLVMLFPVNLLFGVAGYMVLVGTGTIILRHRPSRQREDSVLSVFHRLTAGLFRNTTPPEAAGDSWEAAG